MANHLVTALTCSLLTTPDNGVIMYSTITAPTFELSTTASYSCNTGYGLSGSQVTRTCEADAMSLSASWSGEALSCPGDYYSSIYTKPLIWVGIPIKPIHIHVNGPEMG